MAYYAYLMEDRTRKAMPRGSCRYAAPAEQVGQAAAAASAHARERAKHLAKGLPKASEGL